MNMWRGRFVFIVLVCLFLLSAQVCAASTIKVGVLTFQPESITAKRWSVLGDYLSSLHPEIHVEIIPLKKEKLERSVVGGQLDYVLTNPAQYIRLKHLYGLSAPLVTVVRGCNNRQVNAFGGTIFTRADNDTISSLKDLSGKSVAVPFKTAFGAFLMQQYELYLHDLPLIDKSQLVITGLPHDNMVMAVLNHKAQVGFARAGTLERMAAHGAIKLDQFKIINQQPLTKYPVQVSTHLYPEWPLAALRHIGWQKQGQMIADLLLMKNAVVDALPFGIKGFRPPADYLPVEELMRKLRVAPFDNVPDIQIGDVWVVYKKEVIIISFFSLTLLILVGYLYWTRKRLRYAQHELKYLNYEMKQLNHELERLARYDGLTGLENRRSFDLNACRLWDQAVAKKQHFGMIMIDIDHFKLYNDALGHPKGDWCLQQVAKALQVACRGENDHVARYGGEEFIIILPNSMSAECERVAERIQQIIQQISILHPNSPVDKIITLSMGCSSCIPQATQQVSDMVQYTDSLLYQAKNNGRNQICCADFQ